MLPLPVNVDQRDKGHRLPCYASSISKTAQNDTSNFYTQRCFFSLVRQAEFSIVIFSVFQLKPPQKIIFPQNQRLKPDTTKQNKDIRTVSARLQRGNSLWKTCSSRQYFFVPTSAVSDSLEIINKERKERSKDSDKL